MPNNIILTTGDANGIGPEIVVKFLATFKRNSNENIAETEITVLGAIDALAQQSDFLKLDLPEKNISYQSTQTHSIGETSYLALELAVQQLALGHASALVTAPISKAELQKAGLNFSGHTEILEGLACDLYGQNVTAEMLFTFKQLNVLLLTRHIPLVQVEFALTKARVKQALSTFQHYLSAHSQSHFNTKNEIAVMGLNPHAGEIGGDTETKILRPMIEACNESFSDIKCQGPFAADGLMRTLNAETPEYAGYAACYHDQGLIPIKLLAGFNAVNTTIGLPFIRTSVSHGTAPDIVGQGIASPSSLSVAFNHALKLSQSIKQLLLT